VGAPLYKIDTAASTVSTSNPTAAPAPTKEAVNTPASVPPAAEISVPVPIMGESITSGVLAQWSVKTGDTVKADQVIGSIDTDKVSVEIRAPQDGTVGQSFSKQGDEVNVGNPLFTLIPGAASSSTSSSTPAPAAPTATKTAAPPKESKPAATTPPPATVTPAAAAVPAKTDKKKETTSSATTTTAVGARSETRVKLTRMRQRISSRLKEAQNTAAMLTTFQEVDMGPLMDLRNKHKDEFEKKHGVKLGFMSAFVRAATVALQEIPAVNGVIDDATQEVVYRNYVDISVAVASPKGLVVPVLRNTENMSFSVSY
jgi:2-oxoglutarate dehydrogenase E2 component (dihydrolipoamide succinyltransferase)